MLEIAAVWEAQANAEVPELDPLFSDYVEKFLTRKGLSKRENTVLSYQGYARTWVLPYFGKAKVRDIRLSHLEAFLVEVLKTRSVSSAKKFFVVINGALTEAKRDGIIDRNFWDDIEYPQKKKFEKQILTPEEATKLLNALQSEGEPMLSAVVLGACYGLRREEVCGLRWKDIDFENNVMYIRNTVTQNGGLILEEERTKTDAGTRTIALLKTTIPYFKQLKATQKANGLALDKVCRWPNGKAVQPSYITQKFSKLLSKYELPQVRFHDLRHTSASMALSRLPIFQVKEFLGHEDISTTADIYGSLLDSGRKQTAEVMDSFYTGVAFCSESCSEQGTAESTAS